MYVSTKGTDNKAVMGHKREMTETEHNKGYGFGARVEFGNGLGEQQDIIP